ncbi:MaoC family dehydratase [Martelella mediterranea]|uniref:MaoC family dehydratase n=1 Tax=Martelella mediterranea TaxID=293089 RepID=UPI001E6205F6|nr:MaoC family dehydratase [Martelella mediterranea]MCD1634037.1 MaoC family dehydratase [Martelella mediterranea]
MDSASVSLEALQSRIGREIGYSDWREVSQDRIDRFAEATDDHQFIHVDPDRARKSPFGTTIAHGFLSLSLLSALFDDAVGAIEGVSLSVNYGFNSVRMVSPVKAGSRIKGRFVLKDLVARKPGQWQLTLDVTVDIEHEDKPALVCEWLILVVV